MATKIRLRRMGAKKAPFYRIIVADSRYPRDGRFIEEIGYYDPVKQPAQLKVNIVKAKEWLKSGAEVSPTVKSLFKKSGVYQESSPSEEVILREEALKEEIDV